MGRYPPWIGVVLIGLLATTVASADAHLVLRDGQVLSGTSLEQEDGLYLLTLESGDVLPLPAALVLEVHRSATRAEEDPAEQDGPAPLPQLEMELVPAQPRELPSDDIGVPERPRRLIELPDGGRSASTFSRSLIDPAYVLESGYAERPMLGVFDESLWGGGPLDPNWKLDSGWELPEGEPTLHPDRWNKAAQRPFWKPKDGFADDDP
jgi:hypothetical protein